MFNRVSAVVLFVHDFETSLAFYRDTLCLPVAQLEPIFAAFKMSDQDFALIDMSAAVEEVGAAIRAFEEQTGKLNHAMLCARVDNVDEIYETLKAKGVEFIQGPINQPWGLRAIYFRDPEGHIWQFAHPLTAEQ